MNTFSLVFILMVLRVSSASMYPSIFNSTEDTRFLTFEAWSRFSSSDRYYGEIIITKKNNSVRFNAIHKNHRYFYDAEKMMLDDVCLLVSPPIPTEIESFFKSAELIKNHPSLSDSIYDPLILQYFHSPRNYKLFRLDYLGLTYVIVIKDGELTSVISKHLVVEFHPRSRNSPNTRISQPQALQSCPINNQDEMTLYNSNPNLPWYEDVNICSYPWLSHVKLCPVRNEDNMKECVFLHGVGNPASMSGPPVSKWPEYWGDVDQYVVNHCSKITFLRLETQTRGWDNPELQQEACDGMSDPDGIIRNKVLYIHSMGNNVLAGAIKSGRCRLEVESSKWFNAHGPAKGSPTADFLKEICENPEKSDVLRYIAKVLGYCQKNNTVFPAYFTLSPSYPGLSDLYDIIDKYATGRMCGTDSFGLTSKYSAALAALSKMSMDGRINDGMVNINSCRTTKTNKYQKDYHSKFYLGSFNHADGTCRNSNGYYSFDRQPCSWYGENY